MSIVRKCWTEPSFVHRGENFSIPPSYTKWNHKQTIAYFQMDKRTGGLKRIQFERPRHGVNPPVFRAILGA